MGRVHRPVQDRAVATELRTLRCDAGLTQQVVAARLRWSESTVSRVENVRGPVRLEDVPRLLDLYEASDDDRARVMMLAEQAAGPGSAYMRPSAGTQLDAILEKLTAIHALLEKAMTHEVDVQ